MKKKLSFLLGEGYEYSVVHRSIEFSGIVLYFVFSLLIGFEVFRALRGYFSSHTIWVVTLLPLVSYMIADFISGFVHWMGDTFGSPETPVLGPNFVRPFREHHTDPKEITRHDFIEVNGNNCILTLLVLVPLYYFIPVSTTMWGMYLGASMVMMNFGIFMTNQFHKWSHMENPPKIAAALQRWHLILPPDHHDIHHTSPYDRYYCITCGWMNPILDKLQFFERLERLIRWVTRSPRPNPEKSAS